MYFVVHPSSQMSMFICVSIKTQQNAHNLCRAYLSRKTKGRAPHKALCFDIRSGSDQDLHHLSIVLLHGFVKGRTAAGAFGCVDVRTPFDQKPNYFGVTPIYRVEKRDIPPKCESLCSIRHLGPDS